MTHDKTHSDSLVTIKVYSDSATTNQSLLKLTQIILSLIQILEGGVKTHTHSDKTHSVSIVNINVHFDSTKTNQFFLKFILTLLSLIQTSLKLIQLTLILVKTLIKRTLILLWLFRIQTQLSKTISSTRLQNIFKTNSDSAKIHSAMWLLLGFVTALIRLVYDSDTVVICKGSFCLC